MVVNFFWSGDDWTFLHNLTIKSHIKVGHEVVIWLHGGVPKSKWWSSTGINIKDADEVVDISSFMKKGGNFKTASSLWRFTFLYEYGGWYADTDAVAIRHWPNCDWVLCSGDKGMISTGILKVPQKDPMFLDMIDNLKFDWGNVKVFNTSYKKFKNNNTPTHESHLFFPYTWTEWDKILQPTGTIPTKNVFSFHLYHTMFEREEMIDNIDEWCIRNPNTILGFLNKWVS